MMAHETDIIRQLVKDASGMTFSADKAYLIESRLLPVVQRHNLASVSDLVAQLKRPDHAILLKAVVDALTINETSFLRDGRPFETLRRYVVPELVKSNADTRSFRIWCAAASTGQEPYSVAMSLAEERARLGGFNYQIIGTDISPSALKRANEARYSMFEMSRGLPEPLRSRYFDQIGDSWTAKASIRAPITFSEHNLVADAARFGSFDVVFCRNVLIYFDLPTKQKVLDQIFRRLRPGGYLLLGAAETIIGISEQFRIVPGYSGLYRSTKGETPKGQTPTRAELAAA